MLIKFSIKFGECQTWEHQLEKSDCCELEWQMQMRNMQMRMFRSLKGIIYALSGISANSLLLFERGVRL